MKGTIRMDLSDFVVEHRKRTDGRRRRCQTCSLDPALLAQVHAGRARSPKPISYELISKWLEEHHDVVIQATTLRNHFVSRHHRD